MIILLIAVVIGIGYAALSATLNINGQTTISKASWDIHFENLKVTDGSITATTPATIEANSTTVNFGITLSKPGEFYEFSVDTVNKGTIDAMISTISKTGLSIEQAKYLNYIVEYSSGAAVEQNQLLSSGEKETIKVRIEFRSDLEASSLPSTEDNLNLTFSISYQQKESNTVAVSHSICKRAATLHTEVCNQAANYCVGSGYETGDTITYGNLGTTGVLTSGDAFDCDVNGDGVYDSGTERFYYVSDKDADSSSDYVTLIYYSNVSNGVINNVQGYNYLMDNSLGPVNAIIHLPTISQWPNVNLSNVVRNITEDTGTVRIEGFSYEGYAARLLTYQEVYSGCYDGTTSITSTNGLNAKCQYLMENTKYANTDTYSFVLENLEDKTTSTTTLGISPYTVSVGIPAYDTKIGIRPAIEVLKSKIAY